eukprot:COSAG01_NODE_869_length_13031_cov_28.329467_6_plen_79_part_00
MRRLLCAYGAYYLKIFVTTHTVEGFTHEDHTHVLLFYQDHTQRGTLAGVSQSDINQRDNIYTELTTTNYTTTIDLRPY